MSRRIAAGIQLAIATLLLTVFAPAPSYAGNVNLWHHNPDDGYAEPFHVYCQNTGLRLIYPGQGANGAACDAFFRIDVIAGQEIWCYQSYAWTKWLGPGSYTFSNVSKDCVSRVA